MIHPGNGRFRGRGVGVPSGGYKPGGLLTVTARASGSCSFIDCAPEEGYFTQRADGKGSGFPGSKSVA
jgi:hypothetical protein